METQPPEVQVKMLAGRVTTLETRVTEHGKEIDSLHDMLIRTEERDRFRDEQLSGFGSKLDRIDGKVDLLSIQPAKESAEKWDKAVWIVIGAVIMAAVGYMLGNIGL
ncbi:hypothetical protein DXC81_01490 [Collinsella tanakaei]|uniref:Uncharacterized protein n=1 Tax=Collinsella tanakaei TaxID=626935 RepID=A0A3E4QYR0_9ACTN|nr:hypothetical protein [Collinsella tanakaei]RGL12356.1 hypothetical protein DXC81_01490 [Collinsella tanakaei]